MALYIPRSIFCLARLLYVWPETFGPYNIYVIVHLILIYLGNKHKLLGPNMKSVAERIKSGDNAMTC